MKRSAGHPFDRETATMLLKEGCAELQLNPNPHQIEQLITYMQLMSKWNPVYNLTAIRETAKMVSHHILDSLTTLPHFKSATQEKKGTPCILDVGTGGGLPGIVLAIMQPDWRITLIDPVQKKTAFLNQVKAELDLKGVNVVTGKVEDLPETARFDIITSRAFASLVDFVRLSEKALSSQGNFLALKGQMPKEELESLNRECPNISVHHIHVLQVPQLDAERHLIDLRTTTFE